MTLSGDLSTIDLADLLQNIDTHQRTGTLTLSSDDSVSQLFFSEGRVSLLASDRRSTFVESLVAAGHITRRKLTAAQKKRKGTRRPTVEFLAKTRDLTIDSLREIAEERLAEDVANMVASAKGAFRFVEDARPDREGKWDRDEHALRCSLAVPPLVLEATRRVDDWAVIHQFVPSGTMHFRLRDKVGELAECEDPEFAEWLFQALDGATSVDEIVELAPDQRYHIYKMLATFVRDRVVVPVDCAEMFQIAEEVERQDPERALVLIDRILAAEPRRTEALIAKARLAEGLGCPELAVEAHKLLAHLHHETGDNEESLTELRAAQRLNPDDASLWERALQIAFERGQIDSIRADGMKLVELYRGPGLHPRAAAVLERLIEVMPDDSALHVELARTRVDCGDSHGAVKLLIDHAKMLVGAGEDSRARAAFTEVLEIDPNHERAQQSIKLIDDQHFVRVRERRRRTRRLAIMAGVAAFLGFFAYNELAARIASIQMRSLISRDRMIEDRRYNEVIELWKSVRDDYPYALTSWFDVPTCIEDFEQRLEEIREGGRLDRMDQPAPRD